MSRLILGPPGSGKTSRLVEVALRAAEADKEQLPALVLTAGRAGVAHTVAAVRHARGSGAAGALVPQTVADAAMDLLWEHGPEAGHWGVRVTRHADVLQLLVDNIGDLGLDRLALPRDPSAPAEHLLRAFGRLQTAAVSPEAAIEAAEARQAAASSAAKEKQAATQLEVARAFAAFAALKAELGVVDRHDALRAAAELARDTDWAATQFSLVAVDEAHALRPLEAALVRPLLAAARGAAVAADDGVPQAQGVAPAELLPADAEVETLSGSLRSPPDVVAAAAAVMAGEPAAPPTMAFADLGAEVAGVAAVVAAASHKHNTSAAVLVVRPSMVRDVAYALMEAGVDVHCPALLGRAVFRAEPVRLAMSILRLLLDPADEPSLFHALASPPFSVPQAALREMAQAEGGLPAGAAASEHLGVAALRDLLAALDAASGEGTAAVALQLLRETGRVGDWLTPASPAQAADALAASAFFDAVAAATDAVDSDQPALVVPRLEEMRRLGVGFGGSSAAASADRPRAVPVLRLDEAAELPAEGVDLLVLAGATRSALPGRNVLPRFATFERSRAEHDAQVRAQVRAALLRSRDRVLVTWARAYAGTTSEHELSGYFSGGGGGVVAVAAGSPEEPREEVQQQQQQQDDDAPLKLSFSRIDRYLRCPRQYYYQYHVGLSAPAAPVMLYGGAMHAAIEWVAGHLPDGALPAPAEAEEWLRDEFARRGLGAGAHTAALLEQGAAGIRAFVERLAAQDPAPRVLAVERAFAVDLPEHGVRLRGVVDRVDRTPGGAEGVVLREFKSNVVGDRDVAPLARTLQLPLYSLAWAREHGGELPARVELEGIESGATVALEPDAAMLERADAAVAEVAAGIRAQRFAATPGFMQCQFCAFAHVCPSVR